MAAGDRWGHPIAVAEQLGRGLTGQVVAFIADDSSEIEVATLPKPVLVGESAVSDESACGQAAEGCLGGRKGVLG